MHSDMPTSLATTKGKDVGMSEIEFATLAPDCRDDVRSLLFPIPKHHSDCHRADADTLGRATTHSTIFNINH
jgi:hypothetical protein